MILFELDRSCFLEIPQTGAYSFFVDGSQRGSRDFQRYPSVFFRNIKALRMQIRVESTLRFDIRVGNVIAF